MKHHAAWAVILAGDDGTRLRFLTRLLAREDRPKQFCRLYGSSTLLAQTRSRLSHAISPERTQITVVKAHERFYTSELADVTSSHLVVQPSSRGTTAAIVSSLLRVTALADDPIVGFFPSDHFYSNEALFLDSVRLAVSVARRRPETVILLGANAEHPEVEYGWIEPGESIECRFTKSLHGVTRFWEKPTAPIAKALLVRGCLWNTFVMVGRASAFLAIVKATVPQMLRALVDDKCRDGVVADLAHGAEVFESLAPNDFSREVLSVSADQCAVLRLGNVGWSDLGTPERVIFAMARSGLSFRWQDTNHNENLGDLAKTSVS